MTNFINFSRHFVLGLAFVGVMGGAGGIAGAVGGVILGLLGHTVLGITSSMVMFMPAGIAVGSVAAMLFGISIMRRDGQTLAWQPSAPALQQENM